MKLVLPATEIKDNLFVGEIFLAVKGYRLHMAVSKKWKNAIHR